MRISDWSSDVCSSDLKPVAEADPPTRTIRLGDGVAAVEAAAWDALAGGANPFVGHDFLALLEESGSVGPGTGWQAAPLLVEDGAGALVAAAPASLKTHSRSEENTSEHQSLMRIPY